MTAHIRLIVVLGALATVIAVAGAMYMKGRGDGYASAQVEARQQLIDQITERNRIDEDVRNMSSADLCRRLGGVYVNGECQ